jgi:hypothetical protein
MWPRDGPRIRERLPISSTLTCKSIKNYYFLIFIYFYNFFFQKRSKNKVFTNMQEGLEPCKEKVLRRFDLLYNTYIIYKK